jgi:hypothetical protein
MMKQLDEEFLTKITAFDYLKGIDLDGQSFTTKAIMTFLKIKFREDALVFGMISPQQSEAITRVDEALDELFKLFKDQYANNILNGLKE